MTASSAAKARAARAQSATVGREGITQGMPVAARLAIEHAVTGVLDESESVAQAIPQVIRVICEALGWVGGARWGAGETVADLRCAETWGLDEPAIQAFIDVTRRHRPAKQPGGLIGRAWAERKPIWIRDVTQEHGFRRAAAAAAAGLHSAFAFAIRAGTQVSGVMEFFSREVRQPDVELLEAMSYVGSQLGQFLRRKEAEAVLRENEERFRSLTELSADFYWETDAQHRLLRTHHGHMHRPLTKDGRQFGKARWELPSTYPDAAGWAEHRARLEEHLPFRDFEFARLDDEGVERYLCVGGEPIFEPSGAFVGYRGIGKDITARKREAQLLNLEHTVARALSDAADAGSGVKAVLRAVCQTNGWDCGRYFRRGEDGAFHFGESWHVAGEPLERFIAYSKNKVFPVGVGIVGLAGAGEIIWVEDIGADPRMVSKAMATEHGMRGAFMFAALAEGAAIGVLSFTSREIRKPEERLLSAARMIGSQVGQFLKRKQAEQVLRKSEENFRALTELSSDIYWMQDGEHRFTAFTGSQKTLPSRLIGKRRWDEGALNMTEADWRAHKAVMDAHQTFRDLELKRKNPAGEIFWVAISGSPLFDESGAFVGYRGISRNITARKRAEQLRNLEHTVTRALAAANSASEVLRAAIRAVCETEGWECGRYFSPEAKSGEVRMHVAWGVQDEAVQRYVSGSHDLSYAPGTGLVGRVWQSGEPLWVADLERDTRVAQKGLAQASGIHCAFVFPVIADGRTIGVLAFNSREAREPEELLLQAIRVIGIQIGQFVQRKQAEEVVRDSEERFRRLTTLSSDLYWEQDELFRFTSFSGIGSQRVNSKSLPVLGKKRWEQNYINMSAEDWAKHIALLEEHKPFRDMELCRLDDKGEKVWINISGEAMFDAVGKFRGYRGVGKDITSRKLDEEHIQYLANHDALTALPNRAMFGELLTHSIHNARRYGRNFAVLFVDLDRFKVINDTLGHEAGDRLLKEVGARLTHTVRASDVVARLGGDEFVILVQEVNEPQQVEAVARKVLSALIKPVYIRGQEYRVTASIGICMYPSDADDEQSIMKNADIAMYRAKEEGKNTYKFYSAESNSHSFERLALETSLRRGLERNEFLLHYQAKLDLHTGEITGVEALVRWQHPDLGMVPPAQFIPLAEETGLIVPLGKWVLETACAQNMAWQRDGLPPVRMSVNLSARQFTDENLLKDIAAALERSGMPPELLELELTESMVMQNAEHAAGVLAAIKNTGARLAIDDFGVGYSSLTHLKRFPIDTLKVDRSFIRDIPQDAEDKAITEAIIAMGKSLNLTVVAEGVETLEQQNFLKEHDCDELQGFYFAKPMPSDNFGELLRKRVRAAA